MPFELSFKFEQSTEHLGVVVPKPAVPNLRLNFSLPQLGQPVGHLLREARRREL